MRKSLLATALALLFSAAASPSAFAFGDETLRVHVSFPFHVVDTTLPPGDYVIKSAQGIDPALYEIWSADGKTAMFFLTERREPDPAGRKPRTWPSTRSARRGSCARSRSPARPADSSWSRPRRARPS
jgi:hypothetical protein